MKLRDTDIEKLNRFLERLEKDIYPEPPLEYHTEITEQMIKRFFARRSLPAQGAILDVGCGQGVALERFRALGFNPVGITLGPEDLAACRQKGLDVRAMDQSFLDFADAAFDLVWCRHCLEHSVFPYFTLYEFFRTLKPGGYLYVEVPAPDTSARHQTNRNHYSVLGKSMWADLMKRAGFISKGILDIRFEIKAGQDEYWAFILQKPPAGSSRGTV